MNGDTFKIFVSLPMRGIAIGEIKRRQKEIFNKFASPNWELLDTVTVDNNPEAIGNDLWYLGRSIQILGKADLIIFASNWKTARGCIVEMRVSEAYGIPAMFE